MSVAADTTPPIVTTKHGAAQASMRKTTYLASAATLVLALGAVGAAASAGGVLAVPLFAAALLAGWLAWSGRVTHARQSAVDSGEPDLFLVRNSPRSESALRGGVNLRMAAARRWLARRWLRQPLLVADTVVVAPIDSIRATLDANGCLDGLPFMREMERYCGRTMRVYRVVDKIYDYGRSKLMRRLEDCVLLLDLRCDGSDHGGCEAACYLVWKSAWLRPSGRGGGADVEPTAPRTAEPSPPPADGVYRCQYTQLTASSHAMNQADLASLVGPLIVGNVTLGAFMVALRTRSFNAVQRWRGGATYPSMPLPTDDKSLQWEVLQPGDRVRVKSPASLAPAMNRNSKHRGLWFDRDMLKHCGQERRVMARIGKIIDIQSGRMIPMKTPCIVLEGVDYSGEFQGFGEQHDYLYWREAWLERLAPPSDREAPPSDREVLSSDRQAAARNDTSAK